MSVATAKRLAVLLIVALVLRLAAGVLWQTRIDQRFAFGDSQSYWSLARSIAFGEPYRYGPVDGSVFRTPGYPLLLAPIFLVGGENPSVPWARALGAVFGTLAVLGVWSLARMLFDSTAGWIAGGIAAVYPGAIATSILVLSEAPFCPLMLANLALWVIAWRAATGRGAAAWAIGAGMIGGAATLVRPSWLLFLPFAVLLGIVLDHQRKRHAALGLAMLLGLVVVMTPWWVRNARVTGRFVPTALQVGASLYDGLNPEATGASDMGFVDRFVAETRRAPDEAGVPLEVRLDRRMRDAALAWARAYPGRVLQLAGIKLLRMWNVWPNEASLSMWPVRLAITATYVPVMLLGVLGAVATIRLGWPYVLCWLPAVYFTLLHVIFVSSIRYRQPAMLGIMVLAAGFVSMRMQMGKNSQEDNCATL
ncbi:MAG: glycosyltransferase family 39 protein [Planctomycetia bacterium]|nr:glycosyltransferase family 39 protein [Planctomycetia bacterium]